MMNRTIPVIFLLLLIVGCRESGQRYQLDPAAADYAAPAILTGRVLHPEQRNSDKASIETEVHPFLELLNGVIRQSDGQVIYISLGAAWCEPCILEKEGQNRLIEEFKGQPLRVIAIYKE